MQVHQRSIADFKGWARTAGHVWVIGWFTWSLRFIVAFQPKSWAEKPVVPSLLQFVLDAMGEI